MNIDYYIEQAASMPNTSDGGSAAYHFDDVVLVKYIGSTIHRIARQGEEEIAVIANRKNEMGVRTPKHLAIKRVDEGDENICWVLQERAKGKSLESYTMSRKKDVNLQLEDQKILAAAPSSHYEKFIEDICQLANMGFESKTKNLFYDESVLDGGFTIIDLIKANETPLNPTSIKDLLNLIDIVAVVYNNTEICSTLWATPEQVAISHQLAVKIKQRVFEAMEKVIPSFKQYKKWILRTFSCSDLEILDKNGFEVGDLSLNSDEYAQFDEIVQMTIDACLKQIENNERKFWEISTNEIPDALRIWGLSATWLYHNENKRKIEDYEGGFDSYLFLGDSIRDLKQLINQEFNKRLEHLAMDSDNPYVLQAKQDLDEARRRKIM